MRNEGPDPHPINSSLGDHGRNSPSRRQSDIVAEDIGDDREKERIECSFVFELKANIRIAYKQKRLVCLYIDRNIEKNSIIIVVPPPRLPPPPCPNMATLRRRMSVTAGRRRCFGTNSSTWVVVPSNGSGTRPVVGPGAGRRVGLEPLASKNGWG